MVTPHHACRRLPAKRRLFAPIGLISCLALLASCGTLARTPYTAAEAARPEVLDVAALRYFADDPIQSLDALRPRATVNGEITYLALSGGGADGAFGAGFLAGLSDAGKRPEFSAVSGVSTGALIAPFAFLGPQYDQKLKELYTSGIASSLAQGGGPLSILSTSGPFANHRLERLVDRYVDAQLLQAVAAENAKGRRLLVVTTNLDTQRTNIWDMGRIAQVGTPDALTLFRKVLTASASIPVVFPPVAIEVEAAGHHFEELHVDGGVTSPVLTLPETFLLRERRVPGSPINMYMLINNEVDRRFEVVQGDTKSLAVRSASTLVKVQTRSTIFDSYHLTRRNNFKFNLAYVGSDFREQATQDFSTSFMRALYRYGYEKGRSPSAWVHQPPPEALH